jgi:hypothetical protein
MMAKAGKVDALGSPKPAPVRADFGLSLTAFAKMTGVPAATLAKWEGGTASLGTDARRRIDRVAAILKRLARVMRRSFVPTWIEQPNKVCTELGVRTPLDLFERRDYQALEDMVFSMESGTPD